MKSINRLSTVRLKLVGLNLENFLFDFVCAGMCAKKLKKRKNSLIFSTSAENLKAINLIAKKYDQKVNIIKTTGLIFLLKKLPYCVGGFLGIVFSTVFVWFMTSKISSVEIETTNRIGNYCRITNEQVEEVAVFLSDNNVAVGANVTFSFRDVENKLVANFDFLESCSISRVGTKISVLLREAAKKEKQKSSKIVASNNGIIASITTFSGKALVKAGDLVLKGQVLVESDGEIFPAADIKLKTWKVGTAFHFSKKQEMQPTGKVQTTKAIVMYGTEILKPTASKFSNYETEIEVTKVSNLLPIYVKTIKYIEMTVCESVESFDSVKEEVFAKAKAAALDGVEVSPVECNYSVVKEGDTTKVDCYAQVIEQIYVNNF